MGNVATFTWPSSRDNKPESARSSFDAGAVKADLAELGAENADDICAPFQFMYALSSNFGDDDGRLAHAYRFCPCPLHDCHDSVAAAAHEQAEGLDRRLVNSRECWWRIGRCQLQQQPSFPRVARWGALQMLSGPQEDSHGASGRGASLGACAQRTAATSAVRRDAHGAAT